jgi:tetratricopeptide (TPR) repeat protein
MVFYSWGILHRVQDRDDLALQDFTRTVELDPSFAIGYSQIGFILVRLGRVEEGLGKILYALHLSPNDPMLRYIYSQKGMAELEFGDYPAALESERRAYELNLHTLRTHATLAALYAWLGDRPNALSQLADVRQLEAQADTTVSVGICENHPAQFPRYNEGLCRALDWSQEASNASR